MKEKHSIYLELLAWHTSIPPVLDGNYSVFFLYHQFLLSYVSFVFYLYLPPIYLFPLCA